ncbi:DUF3348 domain-containing protein [Variovorax sp. J22R133]|uniref:DUF3348 domain-containing protein n=1 Tax=Variovorax brevis TaxID=3053503 RepID=UPI00257607A1|nr:DUF3348 domain-containing protein [Variovorax sp. J22R133]MDM0114131.1 DUF3348 domain-containing protein [Variovorax sp. J22R133]
MAKVLRRPGFNDSALIRLLARLTDIDVPESKRDFADRLSQWFSWTDAISLSSALNGPVATAPAAARGSASAEEAECARVRAGLVSAIAEAGAASATADFAPYRQRYVARQQAMETSIGRLRDRLRARLAATSSTDEARLASLDVVMEQVLGAHEQRLLATVPALLHKHFERLRKAHEAKLAEVQLALEGSDSDGVQPATWLEVFGKDMQGVLLAELDLRFQPVEGLLEALRKRQQ